MRRAALLIAAVGLAALASAVALARVGAAPEARAEAIAAAGDFTISNSREGLPIFAAAGIGPGGSARGTVEIADTGSVPVELTLSRHDLLDAPGLGGALLSAALTLTVTDVTAPAAPTAVYAGPLDSMPARPAGRLEPGASRTYEFVATLPASGAGDQNALQGASASVAYAWTATEAAGKPGPGPEAPGGGPVGTPPAIEPAPTPSQPTPSHPGSVATGDGVLQLAVVRAAGALRGGRLLVWAGCDSPCAISVSGRFRGSARGRHHGALVRFGDPRPYRAGAQKLWIGIPSTLRSWLASARGKRHLRARLLITASDQAGASAAIRRTLALRPPRRR